jgi:chromate transporter
MIATTCFLLPSVVAMLAFAATYQSVATLTGVSAALNGLTSAVVGLIALAAYKQGRKTIMNLLGVLIAVVVCATAVRWHVNPALLVITAGIIGIIHEAMNKIGGTPYEVQESVTTP